MAISNGQFGELSGKIGNLVSYNLKGKNIVYHIGKNKDDTACISDSVHLLPLN